MKQAKEVIRFLLRCLCTPFIVFSFGIIWLGWALLLFPVFKLISFIENGDEPCSYRALIHSSSDFFLDPLRIVWGMRGRR